MYGVICWLLLGHKVNNFLQIDALVHKHTHTRAHGAPTKLAVKKHLYIERAKLTRVPKKRQPKLERGRVKYFFENWIHCVLQTEKRATGAKKQQ